jgi:2-amino-4-hydroxy-6-hydroxymethyldihydropteridine diphosphokinase
MMNNVFLLLGSNQGDRLALLHQACALLPPAGVLASSSVYESEPWGFEAEQNFLNQVVQISTNLSPQALLQQAQLVEEKLGRVRTTGSGYTSRPIDVDILFYGSEVVSAPALAIPHPRLHLRRFTLMPLAEIAPDFVHPILKKTMRELLEECEDLHQPPRLFR